MAGTGIHPYHQQWPAAAAAPPPPPPQAAAAAPPPIPHPHPPQILVDNPGRHASDEVLTLSFPQRFYIVNELNLGCLVLLQFSVSWAAYFAQSIVFIFWCCVVLGSNYIYNRAS